MNTRTIQTLAAAIVIAAIPVTYAVAQSGATASEPHKTQNPAVAQGPTRPGAPTQGPGPDPRFAPGGGVQNPQPYNGFNQGPPMMGPGGGGGTAMVSDGQFLFVVSGGMIYKVDKGSLNVVGRMPLNPPMAGGAGYGGPTAPRGGLGGGGGVGR